MSSRWKTCSKCVLSMTGSYARLSESSHGCLLLHLNMLSLCLSNRSCQKVSRICKFSHKTSALKWKGMRGVKAET